MLLLLAAIVHGHTVERLHMVFGASFIPHPEKAAKGGEDAYFFNDALGIFGVSDGVGGSASPTVDPGEYSREMLRRCHKVQSEGDRPSTLPACVRAAAEEQIELGGSATLLLGKLEQRRSDAQYEYSLRLLNLGDSGALVLRPAFRTFRKGKVLWPRVLLRTADQQHYFNCPFQTSAEDFETAGERADQVSTEVRDGDILVAATDGVLDNLYDKNLQVAVARCLPGLRATDPKEAQAAVDELAKVIAKEANAVGLREGEPFRTPFMDHAADEGYRFVGGKLDDVAVVCAVVRCGEQPPPRIGNNFLGAEGVVVPTTAAMAKEAAPTE